jgi:DNA-binding transcriptional ArsR family regulator
LDILYPVILLIESSYRYIERKNWYKVFKELDPILHSQLRLAVISLLISVKEAEFTFLKEKTNATAGNLSVQIQKLKDAGYIDVVKQFKDNYPLTTCKITQNGVEAFESYVKALGEYINR